MSTGAMGIDHVRSAELVADGLLTIKECAAFLRISRSKVYQLMDAGVLCYAKIGRSRRIPRRAVLDVAARAIRGGWGSGWRCDSYEQEVN